MTDQNGPRPGDDSVYDPNPDTAYDDEFALDDSAGSAGGAAAGASGAAGATGASGESGGPPLRGLAMVLTAVAVVLIAWGVYSFASGDEDDGDTGSDTVAGEQDGNGDAGAEDPAATGPDDDTDSDGADGADGASDDDAASRDDDGDDTDGADGADDPDADGANGADGAGGAGDGAAHGGGPAEVDRAAAAVTVLNNSGDPIAQTTADRLREDHQWGNTGYGNLQGRITGISEQTRVYYPEGDAQAQATAEQVAGDLGIDAVSGNPDYYDRFRDADVRNGPDADSVVVVLTGPL